MRPHRQCLECTAQVLTFTAESVTTTKLAGMDENRTHPGRINSAPQTVLKTLGVALNSEPARKGHKPNGPLTVWESARSSSSERPDGTGDGQVQQECTEIVRIVRIHSIITDALVGVVIAFQ